MASQQNGQRTGWELFKYYFNFKQRDLNKLKLEQRNLERKDYEDLQAEYTLAKRKTDFAIKVYKFLKGFNIIAIVIFIGGLISQVTTSYYIKDIAKYRPNNNQIVFAKILVVVTLVVVLITLALILLFAARSVNDKQSRMAMIKSVLEAKKEQRDAEIKAKDSVNHDFERQMGGVTNE